MADLFLCEWPFSLDFDGNVQIVEYEVAHPKAKADWAIVRKEYDDNGKCVRERGYLLVKDSGDTSKMICRTAIVVRWQNGITVLPPECGRLVGAIQCYGGRWSYYVFDSKEQSRATRNTSAETTPPDPSTKLDTSAREAGAPSSPQCTSDASRVPASISSTSDEWSGW